MRVNAGDLVMLKGAVDGPAFYVTDAAEEPESIIIGRYWVGSTITFSSADFWLGDEKVIDRSFELHERLVVTDNSLVDRVLPGVNLILNESVLDLDNE